MNTTSGLREETRATLKTVVELRDFEAGDLLLRQGAASDGLYLIERGSVRVEADVRELDTDVVVGFLEPGMLLGELGLIDGTQRSASAYAHTAVTAGWLSREQFDALCATHPKTVLDLYQHISTGMSGMIRQLNERLVGYLFTEVQEPSVNATVAASVAAQAEFAGWEESAVDALLEAIAEALAAHADALAEATVRETGIGRASDKAFKIRVATRTVYQDLVGRVGCGWLEEDREDSVEELAIPMGVVLGLVPVSNPVPTIAFKTLICLKSRNAILLSCHRGAAGVATRAGEIIREVLVQHGAPADVVQLVQGRTGRRLTTMYMRHPGISFILATGGASMVHAAYSSGTPTIGVGAGNAPVLIAADADLDAAAQAVVTGKGFDHGLVCSSENNLVVERSVHDAFVTALERCGAAVVRPDEAAQTREALLDRGRLRRGVLGQDAEQIAAMAGIERGTPITLVVVPASQEEVTGPLGHEKMAPLLSLFCVDDFEEGLALSGALLRQQGAGHTAVIHSVDRDKIRRFAARMPVSRVLSNVPASVGVAGIGTDLVPSFTLGCGTLGGSSTSDNVTFTHLRNIKRLAYPSGASDR